MSSRIPFPVGDTPWRHHSQWPNCVTLAELEAAGISAQTTARFWKNDFTYDQFTACANRVKKFEMTAYSMSVLTGYTPGPFGPAETMTFSLDDSLSATPTIQQQYQRGREGIFTPPVEPVTPLTTLHTTTTEVELVWDRPFSNQSIWNWNEHPLTPRNAGFSVISQDNWVNLDFTQADQHWHNLVPSVLTLGGDGIQGGITFQLFGNLPNPSSRDNPMGQVIYDATTVDLVTTRKFYPWLKFNVQFSAFQGIGRFTVGARNYQMWSTFRDIQYGGDPDPSTGNPIYAPTEIVSPGSLTIDPVIAPAVTIPLYMYVVSEDGSSPLTTTHTATSGSCSFTLTATEFWPYKNSLGQEVYNTTTGAFNMIGGLPVDPVA